MGPEKFQLEQPTREEMIAVIEKQRPDMEEKLRMLLEKESFLKGKNVYGELYSERQVSVCYDAIFRTEYLRAQILEFVRDEARSVKQIAERLGKSPGEVLWEVVELRRKNLLRIERVDDRTPLYRAS
jgi:DNA-binding transcriptional ArsR family regulator